MALLVQLIILAIAFVEGNTHWMVSFLFVPRCSTYVFVKVGAHPRALWFRTHCLGHGPSVLVWGQLSERRKFGPGAKPWYGVWCTRSQLFVKMGAHGSVPYRVSDTVSDILRVNRAGVIDVY